MMTMPMMPMNEKTAMTLKDVHEKLKSKVEEEMTDSDVYCRMAECAEKEGKEDLAFGLWLIAADEQSHKDFIQQYLEKEHD